MTNIKLVSSKETLEWVRDVALILFGYVAFLYQVYLWGDRNNTIVLVFGILLAIILFLAGLIPNLRTTKKDGEE